jgi:hypothetical protein
MSSAWDNAKKLAEKHASEGGKFVRLQNDGDKIVGVFCGEPYAREVYWDGEKYSDTAPEGGGAKASLRVALNFYVPAEGAMKVIEGGTAWFKDVIEIREKYGIEKWIFEVKRRGKKGDPKTKYSILPETQVDDAMRARMKALPLHDLGSLGAEGDRETAGASSATVDLDVARTIAERLRPLPRESGEAFLAEFKISRIRELRNLDVPAAMRFVDGLERPAADDALL